MLGGFHIMLGGFHIMLGGFHIMLGGFHIMLAGLHTMLGGFHIMLGAQWKYHTTIWNVAHRIKQFLPQYHSIAPVVSDISIDLNPSHSL